MSLQLLSPHPSHRTVRTGLVYGSCLFSFILKQKFILRSFSLSFPYVLRILHKAPTVFYPQGQYAVRISCYSDGRPEPAEFLSRSTADNVSCFVKQLVTKTYGLKSFKEPSNRLHPFATDIAFGTYQPPANHAARSSRFCPPFCCQIS